MTSKEFNLMMKMVLKLIELGNIEEVKALIEEAVDESK